MCVCVCDMKKGTYKNTVNNGACANCLAHKYREIYVYIEGEVGLYMQKGVSRTRQCTHYLVHHLQPELGSTLLGTSSSVRRNCLHTSLNYPLQGASG